MRLSLRNNGLTSLFKEVRVFKVILFRFPLISVSVVSPKTHLKPTLSGIRLFSKEGPEPEAALTQPLILVLRS